VMGGSLGSGVLNTEIARYVDEHRHDGTLAVRQVAGERFAAKIDELGSIADGIIHQVVGYEPDMPAVYAAADLLIGRGGASTVHEVAVTGVPAILVPWAGAADDHQTDNVQWLSEVGAAVLLAEPDLAGLADQIGRLRLVETDRDALSAAALARGEVHRSGALAELIERVALTSATP
jgi:UDP-N-acetylglucosamine--N-acetylmuramyl-(pentapeptide) pyrophosphoryl-undecaprenol N-acetylglucosamine transferase